MTPLKKPKYQVVLVTIPIAAPAGVVVELPLKPDQDYAFVTGVAVSIGNPGTIQGGSYVDIGLRDMTGVIHDDCHIENWQANASVPPDHKFKPFRIPCDGRNVFCRVTPIVIASAQYQIQFILRVEDSLEEIARL